MAGYSPHSGGDPLAGIIFMVHPKYSPHSGGDPELMGCPLYIAEYSPHSGGDPGRSEVLNRRQ